MSTREQLEQTLLTERLPAHAISTRQNLSYVEGHYVTRTLNRIFGPFGWTGEILRLEVSDSTPTKNRAGDEIPSVSYRCVYRLTVRALTQGAPDMPAYYEANKIVEDVGHGDGNQKSAAANHELAMKEAVTDALKRCAARLGDAFGLALYDGQGEDSPNVRPTSLADVVEALARGDLEGAKEMGRRLDGDEREEAKRLVKEAQRG